jgi:hypothetical protein
MESVLGFNLHTIRVTNSKSVSRMLCKSLRRANAGGNYFANIEIENRFQ